MFKQHFFYAIAVLFCFSHLINVMAMDGKKKKQPRVHWHINNVKSVEEFDEYQRELPAHLTDVMLPRSADFVDNFTPKEKALIKCITTDDGVCVDYINEKKKELTRELDNNNVKEYKELLENYTTDEQEAQKKIKSFVDQSAKLKMESSLKKFFVNDHKFADLVRQCYVNQVKGACKTYDDYTKQLQENFEKNPIEIKIHHQFAYKFSKQQLHDIFIKQCGLTRDFFKK